MGRSALVALCLVASAAASPPAPRVSLFPAERAREIHFIRHAEGHHNVATREAGGSNDPLLRGDRPAAECALYDARLTPAGVEQCRALRRRLRADGKLSSFDLVVVSPFTRTLETAMHVFGEPPAGGEDGAPPTLDAGVAYVVREECRERWGLYVCDGRRPMREITADRALAAGFDFSGVADDDDARYEDAREPDDACCARAARFLEWLSRRPEKRIAVVTHSSFLRHLLMQFGDGLSPADAEALRAPVGNCELRSVVLCSHGALEAENRQEEEGAVA